MSVDELKACKGKRLITNKVFQNVKSGTKVAPCTGDIFEYAAAKANIKFDSDGVTITPLDSASYNCTYIQQRTNKISIGTLATDGVFVSDNFAGCSFYVWPIEGGTGYVGAHIYSNNNCETAAEKIKNSFCKGKSSGVVSDKQKGGTDLWAFAFVKGGKASLCWVKVSINKIETGKGPVGPIYSFVPTIQDIIEVK